MRPPLRLDLRTRGTILILVVAVPIIAFNVFLAVGARQQAAQNLRDEAILYARLVAATHEQIVENARNFVVALSELPRLPGWRWERCWDVLARIREKEPTFIGFAAVGLDGFPLCGSQSRSASQVNVSDRSYFRRAIATRDFAIGEYQIGRLTGRASIPFAYPTVGPDGEVTAVWLAVVDVDWLNRLGDDLGLPETWSVLLTSSDGRVLTRMPDPERYAGQPMPDPEPFRHAYEQSEGTFDSVGLDGLRRTYGFKTIRGPAGGFVISVGIPADAAFAGLDQRLLTLLASLLLVSAAAVAAARFGGQRLLVRPIGAIVRAAEELRAGNLGARTGLPHRADEIGGLARGFDEMAAALELRERQRDDAEARLRASEARYSAFFAHAPEGILLVEARPDGAVAFEAVNPAFAEAVGRASEDLVGKTLHEVFEAEVANRLLAHCHDCLRGGVKCEFEESLDLPAGRRVWHVFMVPIWNEAGAAVKLIGSARDITARRDAEERLRQAAKMEAIGQLTGGVAHDFNNLLTVIMGSLERVARRLGPDEKAAALIRSALTAAERGATLNRELLAFARRQPLRPEALDLNQLVADTERLIRRTLGERIEIEVVRAAGLWTTLADRAQVQNALLNLVVNARDAMPDGGKLTIETANAYLGADYAAQHGEITPGQYVMLAVTDTGTGMAPEVAGRAFEPFFTTKAEGKGTGLGLSMVYGFAKQSGGHAKIYSEPGHGTTVKLYLRRAPQTAAQAQVPRTPVPASATSAGETVLVVEDDRAVRAVAAGMLADLGYGVLEAGNADEALALLGVDHIRLLFTDVIMPGAMSGQELAREARRRRPGLKVLFTSGYTENAIIHNGRLDPGVRLLSKPYKRDELAQAVRAALDEDATGE
jgi:PAS domain S-box-containing protein